MKTVDHRGEATLSRKGLFVVAAAIGLVIGALIIFGAILYLDLRDLSRDNKNAISQIKRITNPTPEQFREDLKSGLKRCLKEPSCRRLFPGLTREQKKQLQNLHRRARYEARAAHHLAVIYSRREGQIRPSQSPQTAAPTDSTPTHQISHRPGRKHGAAPPAPTSGGSGGGGGAPATPSTSTAPVGVTTHLPAPVPNPSICTGVANVNC